MTCQSLFLQACCNPSKTAVIHNGRAVSYAAFANAIAGAAKHLDQRSFAAGSTVVVLINNLLDCWVVVAALEQQGCITVCVQSSAMIPSLALDAFEAVVTTDTEVVRHQQAAVDGSDIYVIPGLYYDNDMASEEFNADETSTMAGHILLTSGTTGRYKKVFMPLAGQQHRDRETCKRQHICSETIYHAAYFGLWSAIGYLVPPSVWRVGGTVIIDQRPDWAAHFLNSGTSYAALVPDMASQLLQAVDKLSAPPIPVMDCELQITAGFMSSNLAEQIGRRLTKNLRASYGNTEINIFTLESMVNDLDDWHWLMPSSFRTIEVVDSADNCCASGEEGLVRIQLTAEDAHYYMDNPEASRKVFKNGYFYPGDQAVGRADGRIRILGRSADVLNIRGRKLAVGPIEHKLQNLLGVDQVCIFSGITSSGEEEIVIVVEADKWPEKSVLDSLGEKIIQYDRVRFNIVRQFPRTDMDANKINRRALRKLVYTES